MKSTEELVTRIKEANKDLRKDEEFVSAAYDIKEMFCNLPHYVLMEAVRWITDFWVLQGAKGVMLKNKGKEAKIRMGECQVGWTETRFVEVVRFVEFDLGCTYVMAGGRILKQRIGIPMGKASSPALACLLSAHAEFTFLNSLGMERYLTYGARIVDDISIFVRCKKGDVVSKKKAERVIEKFERCYHENLTLERTDKGSFWEFLGCVVGVKDWPEGIVCAATHKNQVGVQSGRLAFQNLQDYCTYSSRQQKLAVISSFLYRAKRYTTMQGAEAVFLFALKIELRLRGFPDEYFDTALRSFSKKFGGLWEGWVLCLTGWDCYQWRRT
ncbi:hypothetical protein CBR_g31430 [Chara braunii]|uniref:Reverse transcriptase domain-containing protein n=1 Tax=Chara braunii TaxID=69332 RepID=A0A388LEY9_CHABU|nr:hypothetical protein CBR_g31430 [Chara braunii]|eukprot:GBG80874.1 hypothetical protein CBR_g31430 [Chara braunii]